MLNGSRRTRIARGSGMQVSDVNSLVKRFEDAQVMMRAMSKSGGAMPALPGAGGGPGSFGGFPGGKKSKGKQAPQRKVKGKSGNPALRAQQEAAARGKADAAPAAPVARLASAPHRSRRTSTLRPCNADLGKYLRR